MCCAYARGTSAPRLDALAITANDDLHEVEGILDSGASIFQIALRFFRNLAGLGLFGSSRSGRKIILLLRKNLADFLMNRFQNPH